MTSVVALDGVTRKTLHIPVNVCDTVQLFAGCLQCNVGKLEEAENFNVFSRLLCVRIEIDQLWRVNC